MRFHIFGNKTVFKVRSNQKMSVYLEEIIEVIIGD